MFSLRQRELSWNRPLFLLILINFIFGLQTVGGDETNTATDSNDKANEAIKVTGDFVRSETGIEWLNEVMKERKSPLTTLDLASAILKTTSLEPEVLNAAQTLKELVLEGNKDNGNELLESYRKKMIKTPEEHLNNAVEKENDIICLYRKANFDPDMKKAHDWKKLLEIAPGYTIDSVSDMGSKYLICLKKINITITTTVAPIVTTSVETSSVGVSGRKGMSTDNLNKTGETDAKELAANQEDSYEDCTEDEGNENNDNKPQTVNENTTAESTTKETNTEKESPTVTEEPDNLTPNTEDLNDNTNAKINERSMPKKRKPHKPQHEKPTAKNRKNTRRRQYSMRKARKPKRNNNQIDPSYLDPTGRKGSGIRPGMKRKRIRNNRNPPVEHLDPFGKVGYPVRVQRRRISKKRKRLTAIPFVVTVSKIPINPVPAGPSFPDIYSEKLSKVPCQDGYRKILFPLRLFDPLVPLCKPLGIVNQSPSPQPLPNNFANISPYAVMQPVTNIQSNLPNILIPQEYPTQVLAPYVNSYEPPTEIRISVQQPLIEEEYSKNKKSNCDSQSAQVDRDNMNRRSVVDNVYKMMAENVTNAEVTVDTLSSTQISTGEDKTTTSATTAENDTEIAENRMALDDLKKRIEMTSEESATTTSSH